MQTTDAPATATRQRPARWYRIFPATPEQVPQARRFLAACLGDTPRAGDALVCLSELTANAVLHSRSARPGGCFGVAVLRGPGWLRVEVTDEGGPWRPRPAGAEHGRGLAIVTALAGRVHISGLDAGCPQRTVSFGMSLG